MESNIGWQMAVEKYAQGDPVKLEACSVMAKWFPCVSLMADHVMGLLLQLKEEEKARLPESALGFSPPPPAIIIWAMNEVMFSPDPGQRSWFHMYRARVPPPPDTE